MNLMSIDNNSETSFGFT